MVSPFRHYKGFFQSGNKRSCEMVSPLPHYKGFFLSGNKRIQFISKTKHLLVLITTKQ